MSDSMTVVDLVIELSEKARLAKSFEESRDMYRKWYHDEENETKALRKRIEDMQSELDELREAARNVKSMV